MEDKLLSVESTKEEVAEYFEKNYHFVEKAKNAFIKEDISGDVLLEITKNEYKNLRLGFGDWKKLNKFIEENKDKEQFKQKEIKEHITIKSNIEEVKNFFNKCLNFKGCLKDLNGESLLRMNEEGMKSLGLNFGQRKRLQKYIEYFKTIKVEEKIIISEKNSSEKVEPFLVKNVKFSNDSAKENNIKNELSTDLLNIANKDKVVKDKVSKLILGIINFIEVFNFT